MWRYAAGDETIVTKIHRLLISKLAIAADLLVLTFVMLEWHKAAAFALKRFVQELDDTEP